MGDDPEGSDTSCEVCTVRSTNDSGDDASGDDTSCEFTYCITNEYVSGGNCLRCALGTSDASGELVADGESSCDPQTNQPPTDIILNFPGLINTLTINDAMGTVLGTLRAADEDPGDSIAFSTKNPYLQIINGTTLKIRDDYSGGIFPPIDEPPGPAQIIIRATDFEGAYSEESFVINEQFNPLRPGADDGEICGLIVDGIFVDAQYCDTNEYVSAGECVACPGDTTNEPYDKKDQGDTTCDIRSCPADQYLFGDSCVTCAEGTTNVDGFETKCYDILPRLLRDGFEG